MEQNGGNQNMPSASAACVRGCGFYGNSAFDGMCSKCHKETVKRRQHNPSPSPLLSPTTLSASSVAEIIENSTNAQATQSLAEAVANVTASQVENSTTPSVETASPTVPIVSTSTTSPATAEKSDLTELSSAVSSDASAATESSGRDTPTEKDKKPKKNRCHTCKKKVGLTGFECRCGGLYCGLHRYSDKHDCQFDYKELGQEQIRKANPVVVGEKVAKI